MKVEANITLFAGAEPDFAHVVNDDDIIGMVMSEAREHLDQEQAERREGRET